MSDHPAHDPFNSVGSASNQSSSDNSYVGSYVPPVSAPSLNNQASVPQAPMPQMTSRPSDSNSSSDYLADMDATFNDVRVGRSAPTSSFSSAAPAVSAPAPDQAAAPARSVSQSLEDQNIFFLLGVTDGSEEERESFLDELQQVIWEDFVENDVELLITDEEMQQFSQIMAKGDSPEVQEEMIVYLEKLIPDLEEIMLEKALELKEDMVRERMAGMKEYFQQRPDALQKIDQAEMLVNQDQWRAAAEVLNTLK